MTKTIRALLAVGAEPRAGDKQNFTRLEIKAGNVSAAVARTVIVPGPFWLTVLFYFGIVLAPALAGGAFGALPAGTNFEALLERAWPAA